MSQICHINNGISAVLCTFLIICKEKYPKVHAPQNNLALCYQELSMVNKANEIFENLLDQFPEEHVSYVNYAMFLSEVGNIEKAKKIHFDALKKFKNTLSLILMSCSSQRLSKSLIVHR